MLDPMDMAMDDYEVNDLKDWWEGDLAVSWFPSPKPLLLIDLRVLICWQEKRLRSFLLAPSKARGLRYILHHPKSAHAAFYATRNIKTSMTYIFLLAPGVERKASSPLPYGSEMNWKIASYQGFSTRKFPVYKVLSCLSVALFRGAPDLTVSGKIQKAAIEL